MGWSWFARNDSNDSEPMALCVPVDDAQVEIQLTQHSQSIADDSLLLVPP